MMDIADSIINYSDKLEVLTQLHSDLMAQSDVQVSPYVLKIYAYLDSMDEVKRLIKSNDVDSLLKYHCNQNYTSLNPVLTDDMINDLVHLTRASFKHLVGLLKQYKELITDPDAYYKKLRDAELHSSAEQINFLKRDHQRNLETYRQMLEVQGKTYKPYDFDFIVENYDRKMIVDHWNAMMELDLKSMFSHPYRGLFEMSQDGLNKFSDHPMVQYYGHSGSSMSWICAKLHQFVSQPWQETVNQYLNGYAMVIAKIQDYQTQTGNDVLNN